MTSEEPGESRASRTFRHLAALLLTGGGIWGETARGGGRAWADGLESAGVEERMEERMGGGLLPERGGFPFQKPTQTGRQSRQTSASLLVGR